MTFSATLPENVGMDSVSDPILTLIVPAPEGCSLACPFCFIAQRQEKATSTDLTASDYRLFIDALSYQSRLSAICIQGYEPLLPNSFHYTQEVLATGKHLGIPTSLVTNGTHLRQHVPALSKLRPARIAVSLDSADPAVHDKTRGKDGAFDDTLAGLTFAVSVPVLKKALVVTSILMPKKRERFDAEKAGAVDGDAEAAFGAWHRSLGGECAGQGW